MRKIRFSHEVIDQLKSIEEGVFKATAVLLLSGVFSSMYLKNVLEELYASGPYMLISADTILCHARPNSHVYEAFVSHLETKEPVRYEGRDIRHLFVFGATSNDEHRRLLSRISRFISSEDIYDETTMSMAFSEPLEEDA